MLVRSYAAELPLQVFRPSIVVGERETGWTPAFNVIYAPLKAFAKGNTTPVMPARRRSPVDVVPVDYVADAIYALAGGGIDAEPGKTYSLAAGPQASSVGELIDMSAATFQRPRAVRAAAVGLPPHRPPGAADARDRRQTPLAGAQRGLLPYFALRASYDTTRAQGTLAQRGIEVTPLSGYFDRLVGYAVTAQWGKRPLTRVEAAANARRQPRFATPPTTLAHPAAVSAATAAAMSARRAGRVRARA